MDKVHFRSQMPTNDELVQLLVDEKIEAFNTKIKQYLEGVEWGKTKNLTLKTYDALKGKNLDGVHLSNLNIISERKDIEEGIAKMLAKQNVDLSGTKLNGAQLNWTYISDAKLNGVELNGAQLENAWFTRVELNGAQLNNALCNNAKFSEAQFNNATFYDANFNGAKLNGANFNGAELNRAQFSKVSLNGREVGFRRLSLLQDNIFLVDHGETTGTKILDGEFWGSPAKYQAFLSEKHPEDQHRQALLLYTKIAFNPAP